MDNFRLPLGAWVAAGVDALTETFSPFFDIIKFIFGALYDAVELALLTPPFWVIILVAALLGLVLKGWKFALGSILGLLAIVSVNQWENAMESLSLVLVASAVAVIISIPLGILAAQSDLASAIIRPVLDFMQTLPAFVYLVPALLFFGIGVVPGMVATIIFAMAPGVRLTELGIRGVDSEVVEAGQAFGSSPWRILFQIQLPLATKTIMAGVNQVIMLSLSMVVIAGIVGAGGLGGDVLQALSRIDVGLGAEAGISVVILAIFLDRLTATLGGGGRSRFRFRGTRSTTATPGPATPASDASDETDRQEQRRSPNLF